MEAISVDQAAEALGVSPRRVRALIGSKRVPAVRIGRSWALDPNLLRPHALRRGGRPVSADNAWALLALLSRAEAPWVDVFSRSRLKRRALNGEWVEKALQFSEPRSAIHSWRVLEADLPKLRDYGLVRSGLAAQVPGLDIVPMRNELDGYVSAKSLGQMEKRFRPAKASENPNVVLRVPSQSWILSQGPAAPPAVIAADLLGHADGRVARAGRRLLEKIARR
jgi:excisionase family DNA binding protein